MRTREEGRADGGCFGERKRDKNEGKIGLRLMIILEFYGNMAQLSHEITFIRNWGAQNSIARVGLRSMPKEWSCG
jgi:hypothetical protein